MRIAPAELLRDPLLDELAAKIDPTRAAPWGKRTDPGDTIWMGVIDGEGRAVSFIQSIYHEFGSGVVLSGSGVNWQNRGCSFSLDPSHINALAPRKRPFHTLNPVVYLREGRPELLLGTQGADGQPQTLVALLTRLIDFGLDPAQALARPRFLLGRTFSDSRDSLKLEEDAGAEVLASLAARGHEVAAIPAQSPLAGLPGGRS